MELSVSIRQIEAAIRNNSDNESILALCDAALQAGDLTAEHIMHVASQLFSQKRMKVVFRLLQSAVEHDTINADILNSLGSLYLQKGDYTTAQASLTRCLQQDPSHVRAHFNLGMLHREQGNLGDAEKAFRTVIGLQPDKTAAHRALAGLVKYQAGDPHLAQMEQLRLSLDPASAAMKDLAFALAKAYEDIGDIDASFSCYKLGNDLKRREKPYDPLADRKLFAALKSIFASSTSRQERAESGQLRPLFIVGMPRSGTTLLEQIIASHTQVYGAGELDVLNRLVAQLQSKALAMPPAAEHPFLRQESLAFIRDSYLAAISNFPDSENVIVDKMPYNFRFIGFIAQAIPEARIIHARRHPMATCWSIYKQSFTGEGNSFAYEQGSIAAYYKLYADLMDFWNETYPGMIHQVSYEALISEPEATVRGMLQHCDLPWEPGCLDFHRSARTVKTASVNQVRRRLYGDSIESWQKFRPHLTTLEDGLGGLVSRYDSG
jgi:tetratricopeptide (TPR) repeat protein